MNDFFSLYDLLIDGIHTDAVIRSTLMGECWTAVETAGHFGMAMTTPVDTAPRMLDRDYCGISEGTCNHRKKLEFVRGRLRHGCRQCFL